MRRQWTERSRGFTTMELIAAVVITMIVTTIAVAGYRLYQRDLPVKYAADRLARALAAARSYAVANNSYYTVQLDRQYQNYWIDETDEFGTVLVPKVTAPEPLGELTRFAGFAFGGNPMGAGGPQVVPILFAPDGSCDDARITLRMDGTPNIYYDVRVYGPTGVGKVIANTAPPVFELLTAAAPAAVAIPAGAVAQRMRSQAVAAPGRRAVGR